jgi:hypothetical protein
MGYVPFVGFATYRRATVMTRFMFVKKKRVVTSTNLISSPHLKIVHYDSHPSSFILAFQQTLDPVRERSLRVITSSIR